jgi:hypothetical protein
MKIPISLSSILALIIASQSTLLAQDTGFSWGIIVGADATPNAALDEVRRVQKALGKQATLIRCNNWIRTVILVSDRRDAIQVLQSAQRKVRSNSYLVDMRIWCPGKRRL